MTGVETEVLSAFLDKDVLMAFGPFFAIILLLIITQWIQAYRDGKMRVAKDKIIMGSIEANKNLKENIFELVTEIKIINNNIINLSNEVKDSGKKVLKVVGKINLPDSELVEIAEDKVLGASFDKLAFIREKLQNYNQVNDENYIKQAVKGKLEKLSSVYIGDLNKYKFSDGTLVGDWVAENFPMEKFLEDIFKIIFAKQTSKDKSKCIHDKINNCQVIMIRYQNKMWEQARNRFNCN